MITNVGFTAGAIAAAKDDGIALHVVEPSFDISALPRGDRAAIQGALRDMAARTAGSLYSHHVEHRGLGFGGESTASGPTPSSAVPRRPRPVVYETRVVSSPAQQVSGPPTNRSIGGGETRGGDGPGPSSRGGGGMVKK